MDSSTLRVVSEEGFESVTLEALADLAAYCGDWCKATGDARFCFLRDIFSHLDKSIDEQGLPTALLAELDSLFTRQLPAILAADDLGHASALASQLEDDVRLLPLHPSGWDAEGGVSGGSFGDDG